MRLFTEHGYAATTVADVAEAAGVSSMTVFRHFPTKEALVLADDYDPLIVERMNARPAGEPLIRRIGMSMAQSIAGLQEDALDLILARARLVLDTPALLSRHWQTQQATQRAIVEALCADTTDQAEVFRVRVSADVALAAASAAIFRWVEEDGKPDLAALMGDALDVVAREARS